MTYTSTNPTDTKIALDITLDAADLKDVRILTLTKLAKTVKVAGFRKGKVPAKVAEKHLDPSVVESQLLEDAINKHVIDILTTESLQPLDRPQVDVKDFKPGESLHFTAEAEILPAVTLGDYKNLKVTHAPIKVTKAEIDEVVERMRLGMAEKKPVTRAAKTGDEVWIDFEGTNDKGEAIAGASGKDYPLSLGSNTFIPGFEEGLVGKKAGDTFDLPLTFPEDYHHEALKGAKVTFAITVKEVKEVILPTVDNDFAKKAGAFETAEQFLDDVKAELTAQKERNSAEELKDQLVEQLVKVSKVPVPDVLLADQLDSLERDTTQNLMYRGQTLEQYLEGKGQTHDEWRDSELKEAATRRVQAGLALAELTKAEDIEISKDEFESRLQEMMQQYTDPKMREQLDTPDARRNLANRVLTEKTVDRLVELNS